MKKHLIRIVGGDYRRTQIVVPDGPGLRPTPDRVRETLFNWLSHFWAGRFSDKRVLDLFAGTGALGFEAASRGVAWAQLVEQSPTALAALHALQRRLNAPNVHIRAGDAPAYLRTPIEPRFDLLMLDPPFGHDWLDRLWPLIPNVLVEGGLVYLETERAADQPPTEFTVLRHGRAGRVHFHLLQFAATQKKVNNPADTLLTAHLQT
ncbi:MAG: RsmD family RNA methyltransferase [Alcaligenaceae bacterium]|nr:RsmD family RNA methyltransferase [Alcaligenaceae bacterium]